jgi:hypothetical protein
LLQVRAPVDLPGLPRSAFGYTRGIMKSAYELAMERLSQKAPSKSLTADQKSRMAELDSVCKARIAQRELSATDEIAAAEAAGDLRKAETIREQFVRERQRFEEERDAKKEKIRDEK